MGASARLNAVKSEPKLDLFEELVDVVDESENRELYSGYYGNNGNNYFNTNDGRGNNRDDHVYNNNNNNDIEKDNGYYYKGNKRYPCITGDCIPSYRTKKTGM